MKTIKVLINEYLLKALSANKADADIKFDLSCPDNPEHGDYSTNLAMILAKRHKVTPLFIAEKLVKESLANIPLFSRVQSVQPGYINFFLSPDYLTKQVEEVLKLKENYCQNQSGKGQKIQVEFISANPTGPLTVGNARGGYLGDVLANVLKASGYKVIKEYLINDAGSQIENLGHSILNDDKAVYHGDYIDQLRQQLSETDPYKLGQQATQIIMEKYIKKTIGEKMKIKFDLWFSEQKEIRNKNKIEKIVEYLKKKNYLYQQDGAWWFKSTQFGDDKDRIMIRSNGEPTYFAQDFAYHKNKFDRGFDLVINVWGADHHGDVSRIKAAAEVLGYKDKVKIILTQFVQLLVDDKEVRMSKRTGNLVLIDDLIAEVGPDATRFYFLKYSAESHMNFDLKQAKEKSEKNPVYYVQYAYARICNILKQKEIGKISKKINLQFTDDLEYNLIKELIKIPDLIMTVATNYQIQGLTATTVNLADKFHQFYANCRVIDNGQVNWSRVKLIQATQIILKSLLDILGISAPEKM